MGKNALECASFRTVFQGHRGKRCFGKRTSDPVFSAVIAYLLIIKSGKLTMQIPCKTKVVVNQPSQIFFKEIVNEIKSFYPF